MIEEIVVPHDAPTAPDMPNRLGKDEKAARAAREANKFCMTRGRRTMIPAGDDGIMLACGLPNGHLGKCRPTYT